MTSNPYADELTSKPAVHLFHASKPAGCFLGGMPRVPGASFAWPVSGDYAVPFLAQIDLAEINGTGHLDWLPRAGVLLFFYDFEEMPWGFDPAEKNLWRVCFLPEVAGGSEPLEPPDSLEEELILPLVPLVGRAGESFPDASDPEIEALGLIDHQIEAYEAARSEVFASGPEHQIGGFPAPVQGNSMALECQLAANGLYCGGPDDFRTPEAEALKPGAVDWRLLFQVDSDDALDICWGDLGKLYFWIREDDLRKADFGTVWMILQCT